MPQIEVWPFIGRTMVEQAHRVKVPNRSCTYRQNATPPKPLCLN